MLKTQCFKFAVATTVALLAACAGNGQKEAGAHSGDDRIGRVEVFTVPLDPEIKLRSATYTPSGKVLLAYYNEDSGNPRDLSLAVVDDDGNNLRTFFSQTIPEREKDNGIRYMVFTDNQRIFLGDFVLECAPNIDECDEPTLYPVQYPAEIASGDHVSHRWSEMIIAPDNQHVAWTTLFSNYSAAIFTGRFVKENGVYRIIDSRAVSTLNAFRPDPDHTDGVLPNPVRNGEVKQFVRGGTAISMVGAQSSDIADSIVQDLMSDDLVQITHSPGYDETTIFSPDERLGIVMSSRFSETTDPAILGLMPKPYPASLNMGLNMHAYTYAVTGVRKARSGNVGPALIDIAASQNEAGYVGINLNTQDEWVYGSPMSWHPSGRKAMWMEGLRGVSRHEGKRRIQVVRLLDYQPGPTVEARKTPDDIAYGYGDLSVISDFLQQSREVDVKVYGKASGFISYRRTARGVIEKTYADFSDDGESIYSGSEKTMINPHGTSTYTADITLSGPKSGRMDLKVTFGPLHDPLPARIIFAQDDGGRSLSHGYTEYDGQRLEISSLVE